MSRELIPMQDGTLLTVGYDEPNATWFAQHYDTHDEDAPPRAVIGYSTAEESLLRDERADAIIGPSPVHELPDLFAHIATVFGIQGHETQPPCWYCKQPTYERNDECPNHPYNRLRFG